MQMKNYATKQLILLNEIKIKICNRYNEDLYTIIIIFLIVG